MENKHPINKSDVDDQIIANQLAGMPLEEAVFQAGYTAGVDFQRNRRGQRGAVWVKASEFKADKPIFRPYRRKSVHEDVDYDYGEIFIELQDDGQLYLDVESENNYTSQSHERWNDYEILDESAGEKDDWISVDDQLPTEGGRYWCYVMHQGDLGVSYFQWNCDYNDQLKRFSDMTLTRGEIVTHWRKLPDPPKRKEVNNG